MTDKNPVPTPTEAQRKVANLNKARELAKLTEAYGKQPGDLDTRAVWKVLSTLCALLVDLAEAAQ